MAIVERFPTRYGWLLAHELGHVLGMQHSWEWEPNEEGPGLGVPKGYCTEERIDNTMHLVRNFREPKPTRRTWSICNRCDLLKFYQEQMIQYGEYCLTSKGNSKVGRDPSHFTEE